MGRNGFLLAQHPVGPGHLHPADPQHGRHLFLGQADALALLPPGGVSQVEESGHFLHGADILVDHQAGRLHVGIHRVEIQGSHGKIRVGTHQGLDRLRLETEHLGGRQRHIAEGGLQHEVELPALDRVQRTGAVEGLDGLVPLVIHQGKTAKPLYDVKQVCDLLAGGRQHMAGRHLFLLPGQPGQLGVKRREMIGKIKAGLLHCPTSSVSFDRNPPPCPLYNRGIDGYPPGGCPAIPKEGWTL